MMLLHFFDLELGFAVALRGWHNRKCWVERLEEDGLTHRTLLECLVLLCRIHKVYQNELE